MGDFERTFGAGADIEKIIDKIVEDRFDEDRQARRTARKLGGQEIFFENYLDAREWEIKNPGVPFTRVRKGEGYLMKISK